MLGVPILFSHESNAKKDHPAQWRGRIGWCVQRERVYDTLAQVQRQRSWRMASAYLTLQWRMRYWSHCHNWSETQYHLQSQCRRLNGEGFSWRTAKYNKWMAALLGKRVKENLAGSSVLPAQIGNRDTITIYSAMGWWTIPNTCFSFLFAEDGIKSVSNSMQTQAALSGNHLLRISAFLRARPVEEPDGKGFFEHSNTHQPTFYKQAKWREGVNNQVQKNDEPFWKQEEAITSKRRRFDQDWGKKGRKNMEILLRL